MKRFSKVALGAIALMVGVGTVATITAKKSQLSEADATDSTATATNGTSNLSNEVASPWSVSNFSKQSGFYQTGGSTGDINSYTFFTSGENPFTYTPTSIIVTLGVAGGSAKSNISGDFYLLDSAGAKITTTKTTKTFSVTKVSADISVTFSSSLNVAYGMTFEFAKIASWNLRLYSGLVQYTYAVSSDPSVVITNKQTGTLSQFVGDHVTLTTRIENNTGLTTVWSSDDADGAIITLTDNAFVCNAPGSVVVTVQLKDGDAIKASDNVTVNVVAPEVYLPVTSLNDIHLGAEVVFVNKTSSKAMADQIVNSSYMDQVAVTIGASSVNQVADIGLFTFGIGALKDTYTFKNTADSKYLTAGSSGTALILSTSESDSTDWSISLGEDGLATVMANNRYLFYNTTYSDFASSTTAPATGKEIYLYQKAAATGQLDTVEATGTLTKSTYKPGDVFDASGLTVNGMFNDADTTIVDLTKWVVWPTTLIVLGQTSVEGSVTVQGVTKTIVENITVEEVTLTKIEITTPATTTTFLLGGTLDTTGLVVTATYSNSTTEDVTTKCTITPANGSTLSTAGTTAVEIAYLGKTTSYNVTVETAAHVLKKITSVDQLVIGAEIVIASDDTNLVAMSSTQNTNNRGQAAISPASNSLSLLASSTAAVFTLGAGTKNESYSLRDTNGYLYAASSSGNYLRSQSTLDANGSWAITVTAEGVATITAQGSYTHNLLQYNASSSLFSCYSSAQKNVVLYEQTTYYNAGSWASGFNTALDATCSNTAPTAIASSTWSEQNTSFSNLGTDEKAILKDLSTADANDGTAAKKAMSRYDYVMGKAAYSSFADFIGRFPSRTPSSAATSLNADKANPMIPLAVLVAGAGATGLIFLAKKRKHD